MRSLAAFAALAAAGVFSAAAVLWSFARFSDQAKIRRVRRQMKASLYEMRLFIDEPRVLLRAQKQLIVSNIRYLGMMLRPIILIMAPMLFLMTMLDTVYGCRPLRAGESALLTVYARPAIDLRAAHTAIEAPSGVAVETPLVRIPGEQRICWRIRATHAGSATLRVSLQDSVYDKSVQTGAGFAWISRERVRSLWAWILDPTEKRLPAGPAERIEVAYPAAALTFAGITLPWIAWYMLATLIATIFLRRRFGVTF
jgi:hypothetical protein